MGVKVLLTLGVAGKAISIRKAKKAIGIIQDLRRHTKYSGRGAKAP
jgi:hypothetical protein